MTGSNGRAHPLWTAVLLDVSGRFDARVEEALAVHGVRVVGRARTAAGALSLLGRRSPHALVCTGDTVEALGIDQRFVRRAHAIDLNLHSILLGDAPPALQGALAAGGEHANGEPPPLEDPPLRLTRRERDVLLLAREGHSNAEIGRALWVTRNTVKFHLANVYGKLGVDSRASAVRAAVEQGLLPVDQPPARRPVSDSAYGRGARSPQATSNM